MPYREEIGRDIEPAQFAPDVYAQGAAFYVALLKNRYFEEADEFAQWFMESFDIELEE